MACYYDVKSQLSSLCSASLATTLLGVRGCVSSVLLDVRNTASCPSHNASLSPYTNFNQILYYEHRFNVCCCIHNISTLHCQWLRAASYPCQYFASSFEMQSPAFAFSVYLCNIVVIVRYGYVKRIRFHLIAESDFYYANCEQRIKLQAGILHQPWCLQRALDEQL